MRHRLAVLASLLTVLMAAVPSTAGAAPKHNDGLTINVAPTHIMAGEGVLIYGQLPGPAVAGQTIRLYHHVALRPGYSLIGTATTDAAGFYEFTRAEGVVLTNRSWFVRGPEGSHSRTVHEPVSALVSLSPDTVSGDTLDNVVFSGHVFPAHPFQRVVLEQRTGAGDDWQAIRTGFTGGDSNYRMAYRWDTPGSHELRVVLPGDRRNVRSYSDPVTLTIQQTQIPGFTVNTSEPMINYYGSTTISGVLDKLGAPGAPDAGVPVTLFGRFAGKTTFQPLATATTGADGSYSFTQSPSHNTLYVVRVTLSPARQTAYVLEGVRDAVTAKTSATISGVGSTVTFTGTALPAPNAGDVVYLQRLGSDGDWHTVKVGFVNGRSAYSISWTLGDAGPQMFRTRVLGNRFNFGGVSPETAITVAPAPSPATLPPAS